MQKNIHWLPATVFFAFISISCSTTHNYTDYAGWMGEYIYKEDPVEAVQGIYQTMTWKLSIVNNNDTCQGILEILGDRTYVKALTAVSGDSSAIDIIYDRLLDGSDEHFVTGETLFSLKRDSGKIITVWNRLQPRLPEYAPEECACFKQKKQKNLKYIPSADGQEHIGQATTR